MLCSVRERGEQKRCCEKMGSPKDGGEGRTSCLALEI